MLSFRWVVLIHTCLSILLHEYTHVHTQVHLKAREYLGMLGPVSGFLQKRVGRYMCTCTKTAQWSSWFCALNKCGDHSSTSYQILLSPWCPKITHAYQTDWAGQTLETVSVPETTTHIVSGIRVSTNYLSYIQSITFRFFQWHLFPFIRKYKAIQQNILLSVFEDYDPSFKSAQSI